jgi:AmmeMemoRadiSam system protein A
MSLLRVLFILHFLVGALGALMVPPGWGGQNAMNLTDADKKLLLMQARASIEAHLHDKPVPPVNNPSAVLSERRGAFVSLHRQGRLRGCIGYLEAVKPLLATVREMAAAAAFQDPRFQPLRPEELDDLEIEISVLSPMKLITSTDEIQVGKLGLYVVQGFCRGLLLPQVATEYKWDRLAFLQQTCCKAGLDPDAWKSPSTKIYTFTAEVFADHSQPGGCFRQEPKSP